MESVIYGHTDAGIAEAMTFFLSLKQTGDVMLVIDDDFDFDFAALSAEQLARILDANPTREFRFGIGIWSAEHSVILATRPYSLNVTLTAGGLAFDDKGTAFVDALETRQAFFGSISLSSNKEDKVFPRDNLERLLKLEVFESLKLNTQYEENGLLPFSAKVTTLNYRMDARLFQPEDFDSLEIAAKDLRLQLYWFDTDGRDRLVISLLNRVAALGHFERLDLAICCHLCISGVNYYDFSTVECVAKALICTIHNNPKLKHLDLFNTHWRVNWGPHYRGIFEAIEEHNGLQTFILNKYPKEEDLSYSWLKKLLSKNHNITVLDCFRWRCSDGFSVDQLYLLNHTYLGSAKLVKETDVSLRPLLVQTALVESVSQNFPRTALLLSNHTDIYANSFKV